MFVTISWGLSFPLSKFVFEGYSPQFSVVIRFLITIVLFVVFCFNRLKTIQKRDYYYGLILSSFLYIGFITQTVGLVYTSASTSAFITGAYIVLLPFAQYFIVRKLPTKINILAILIVTVGMALLTGVHELRGNIGDLLTIICAAAFAMHIVFIDLYTNEKKADFHSLVFGQFTGAAVLCLISTFIFEWPDKFLFQPTFSSTISLLINSIFSTFMGIFLINKYQKYTTPVRAGLIYSMEQVFAVIFSFILLSESLSFIQIIGACIMFTGFILTELIKPKNETIRNNG